MTQNLIEKYKPLFQSEVVLGQVSLMSASVGIASTEINQMVDVLEEMGYSDFLINNTHSLILSDEEMEKLVNTSEKLHSLRNELVEFIGEGKIKELDDILQLKTNQWWETHGDEFSEKMQEIYQKKIDKLHNKG